MKLEEIVKELEKNGSDTTKKYYVRSGAKEDLTFGVPNKNLKDLEKKLKGNNDIAMQLYDTRIYDAMNLAGMIVDVKKMTKNDFNDWISKAYFRMIADYIVAVSLAESDFALELAKEWIESSEELKQSAGWYTYSWVLGVRKDTDIDKNNILELLKKVKKEIGNSFESTKYAMDWFIMTVGISYLPLHKEAFDIANSVNNLDKKFIAKIQIEKAVEKNRLGLKRKNVRC